MRTLFVIATLFGWAGCSAYSPEATSEAKKVKELVPTVAQPVSPPVAEPPSLETFSAFLDRA
jgi:hypothetical protein